MTMPRTSPCLMVSTQTQNLALVEKDKKVFETSVS